jgi:hypothetical protein
MSRNGTVSDNLLEAMQSGKLPSRSPERTWAGPGCGAPCMICDQSITADELEYELEFARGADSKQPEGRHIHFGCFSAWDTARHTLSKRGIEQPIALSGQVTETGLAHDESEISGSDGAT